MIVVGATNHPTVIDPALLRSGRLAPHVQIPRPDVAARMGILRHHLGDHLASIVASAPDPADRGKVSEEQLRRLLTEYTDPLPDAVLRKIARHGIPGLSLGGQSVSQPETDQPDEASIERVLRTLSRKAGGLTGADIEVLVGQAKRKARRQKRAITYGDIESLLAGAKQPRSMMLRYRMAVHEAGHAVTRLYFRLGPIIEITIDAQDGGYTLGTVSQDEQTEELLTAILIANLAGRAAEEEIVCSVTANSGGTERSDLAIANKLALDMETVLGFSRKWPLLYRKAESADGNPWHGSGTRRTRECPARKRQQGGSRHRPRTTSGHRFPGENPDGTGHAGRTGTGRRARTGQAEDGRPAGVRMTSMKGAILCQQLRESCRRVSLRRGGRR